MNEATMEDDLPAASVRPPDLVPASVRDHDPLAGWDVGMATPEPIASAPFPVDTAVVAGAAVLGALVVGLTTRRAGLGRLLVGALAGAVVGGVARGVWRLP